MADPEREMSPVVSVLIPCYNAGRFLKDALDSVLSQTYTDYEIILVDDGSEDNTAEVAGQYPQVCYIRCDHKGVAAARNTALSLAKGEFITFLDADDMWVPQKLEKQMAYMAEHPDCELVYAGVRNYFDGAPENMTKRQKELLEANLDFYMVAACVRRRVFEKYGVFCEDYVYAEDTQWLFRLHAAGIDAKPIIPEVLYLRRIHDNNISLTHKTSGRKDVLALMAGAIRQVKKMKKE